MQTISAVNTVIFAFVAFVATMISTLGLALRRREEEGFALA